MDQENSGCVYLVGEEGRPLEMFVEFGGDEVVEFGNDTLAL